MILVRILFMGPSSPVTWTMYWQSRTFNKLLTHQSTIVNLFPSWLKAPSQGPDLWEEVHYIKTPHNEKYTKPQYTYIYISNMDQLSRRLENRLLKLRLRSSYKLVEGHLLQPLVPWHLVAPGWSKLRNRHYQKYHPSPLTFNFQVQL